MLFSAWICAIFLSFFLSCRSPTLLRNSSQLTPQMFPSAWSWSNMVSSIPLAAKRVIFSLPVARTSWGRLWLGLCPWTCCSDAFLWGRWPTGWALPAFLQACLSECAWVACFPQALVTLSIWASGVLPFCQRELSEFGSSQRKIIWSLFWGLWEQRNEMVMRRVGRVWSQLSLWPLQLILKRDAVGTHSLETHLLELNSTCRHVCCGFCMCWAETCSLACLLFSLCGLQ